MNFAKSVGVCLNLHKFCLKAAEISRTGKISSKKVDRFPKNCNFYAENAFSLFTAIF